LDFLEIFSRYGIDWKTMTNFLEKKDQGNNKVIIARVPDRCAGLLEIQIS